MKEVSSDSVSPSPADESKGVSRRGFIGGLSAAAGAIAAVPLLGGTESTAVAAPAAAAGSTGPGRMNDCFAYRRDAAINSRVNVTQTGNGDVARYSDYSGMYAKGLLHDALGIPNAAAAASLLKAFRTGKQSDFASILVGSPGGGGNAKLNGPQGALAFDLQGIDSHSTVIPPSPTTASASTAADAVEHYWGALLRDVNFTDYATHPLAGQAVNDLNSMSYINGPDNDQVPSPVTRQNLFRGRVVGGANDPNVKGPYISQFMLQPTYYGAQPLSQRYQTFVPGQEFMTTVGAYQNIQNGGSSQGTLLYEDEPRFIRNGRDLAAYTRVDVLFQAYFTAFMILGGLGAAPNPGNPYIGSSTEKGFGTLGGPDAAGTMCEMATRALKASWYHKWVKDLRMRPEAYAALVHARKTNANPMPQAALDLHPDVLNSAVLPLIESEYHSYLLPQPFPEGSPTHPCYPTGHGTVGGACITALKFFFNGAQKIQPLLTAAGGQVSVASSNGMTLVPYGGDDADELDINGELEKLAWNVTVGHGIHAGIHFRSSSYWSLLLGEQVALAVLRDRAKSYNEPFTVSIKKFDGTTATISNR